MDTIEGNDAEHLRGTGSKEVGRQLNWSTKLCCSFSFSRDLTPSRVGSWFTSCPVSSPACLSSKEGGKKEDHPFPCLRKSFDFRFSMGSRVFFVFGPPITPIADHHGMIDFRFGSFPPLSSGRDGGGRKKGIARGVRTRDFAWESLGCTPHVQG